MNADAKLELGFAGLGLTSMGRQFTYGHLFLFKLVLELVIVVLVRCSPSVTAVCCGTTTGFSSLIPGTGSKTEGTPATTFVGLSTLISVAGYPLLWEMGTGSVTGGGNTEGVFNTTEC